MFVSLVSMIVIDISVLTLKLTGHQILRNPIPKRDILSGRRKSYSFWSLSTEPPHYINIKRNPWNGSFSRRIHPG